MIPGEVTLKTAPLVDTRVARLNRAPDGQLRIALVDTATGLEFGSFVLVERTVEAVRRATEAVRVVRDKLAQAAAAPPPPPPPPPTALRADAVEAHEVDALDIHISNTLGCYEKQERIKEAAAAKCAEGRYDRAVVLRDVEKLLIAPCAQGLRAQSKRDDWNVPTHNTATLAAVAERFVRRIEEELFEEEGRKCAAPPVADPHEVDLLFNTIENDRNLYEIRLKIEEEMERGLDRAGALRRIETGIVPTGVIWARRAARGEGFAVPTLNAAVREEVARLVLAKAEESIAWRAKTHQRATVASTSVPVPQSRSAAPSGGRVEARAALPAQMVTERRPEAPPAPRGKVRVKALADDVMEVLRASRVDGNAVHLPPTQIDPKLYKRVAEALESVGAKWDRRARAHVFAKGDARDAFVAMLDAGRMTIEKGLSYFPTPAMLAARVAGLAGAGPGRRILEPSAGEGAIVAALLSLGAEVVAVEYDASRVATLRARFPGITIVQGDFLAMGPAQIGFFDGVAMNPPFSLAGQPQADIDHVMHAATFAHRGAPVAAIVSQGVEFRDDKKSQAFRRFVVKYRGSIETLPAQSFREVGTDVGSSLVTFVSPGVK